MKICEQELLEKTFPFVVYDKTGGERERKEIVMRELPSSEIAAIRERCMSRHRDGEKFDQTRFGRLLAARMIIHAPFETNDDVKWEDMSEKQRLEFVSALSSNYDIQLGRMIQEMDIHVSEEEKNLSKPQ